MSDIVKCDACDQPGRRRAGYCCPDGWHYLETTMRSFGERGVHVTYACSDVCLGALAARWKRGPGPRNIDEEGTERARKRELKRESGS